MVHNEVWVVETVRSDGTDVTQVQLQSCSMEEGFLHFEPEDRSDGGHLAGRACDGRSEQARTFYIQPWTLS